MTKLPPPHPLSGPISSSEKKSATMELPISNVSESLRPSDDLLRSGNFQDSLERIWRQPEAAMNRTSPIARKRVTLKSSVPFHCPKESVQISNGSEIGSSIWTNDPQTQKSSWNSPLSTDATVKTSNQSWTSSFHDLNSSPIMLHYDSGSQHSTISSDQTDSSIMTTDESL